MNTNATTTRSTPSYPWSLGFTQRGCRLNCGFCVVPKKEGRPRAMNSIINIWRPQTERCILLLDNDFFGQPKEQWQARVDEIREGRFKVNFSQGINVRLINRRGRPGPRLHALLRRPVHAAPALHRLGQPGAGENLLPGSRPAGKPPESHPGT